MKKYFFSLLISFIFASSGSALAWDVRDYCSQGDTVCERVVTDVYTRDWRYALGNTNNQAAFVVSATRSQIPPDLQTVPNQREFFTRVIDDRGTPSTADDIEIRPSYTVRFDAQNRTHYMLVDTTYIRAADAYGRTNFDTRSCESYLGAAGDCGFMVSGDFFNGFNSNNVVVGATPQNNVVKKNIYMRYYRPPLGAGSPVALTYLTQTFTYQDIPKALIGDFNNDGAVGLTDLILLRNQFGNAGGSGDLNHDGFVNRGDLAVFITHYGKRASAADVDHQKVVVTSTTNPYSAGDPNRTKSHHVDFNTQQRTEYSITETYLNEILKNKTGTVNVYQLSSGALLGAYTVIWDVNAQGAVTATHVTRTSGTSHFTGGIDPEDIHARVTAGASPIAPEFVQAPQAAAPGALIQKAVAKKPQVAMAYDPVIKELVDQNEMLENQHAIKTFPELKRADHPAMRMDD